MNQPVRPAKRVIVPGEAPFSPLMILLATLTASLIGGGLLAALNWERLYRPARKWPTLIGSAVAFLTGGFAIFMIFLATEQAAVIGAGALLNAAGGAALIYWQRNDYAGWINRYGQPTADQVNLKGALWRLALILFVLVGILLPLVTVTLLPTLRASLPPRTFVGDGLTLTYRTDWRHVEVHDDPVCQQPDTTCLISLRAPSGLLVFDAVRIDGGEDADPDRAADALWAAVQAEDAGAILEARETVTLNGLPAVSLTYTEQNPFAAGERLYVRRWLVVWQGALYRFSAITEQAGALADHAEVLDRLLASVSFVE